MEVSGKLHATAALPLGKEPLVTIGEEAGWAPELVWMGWKGEKFPVLDRNQTQVMQIINIIIFPSKFLIVCMHHCKETQLTLQTLHVHEKKIL
jgi:hypothetical protein